MKKRRNDDTTSANEQRIRNADVFAKQILNKIQIYEFEAGRTMTVGRLVFSLNRDGIATRRGGEWTTTAVQRILKRKIKYEH